LRAMRYCTPMILLLLVLGGCGGNGKNSEEAQALEIRTDYLAMSACSGTAEIRADYGQRVYDYTIDFTWQKEGDMVLTITQPLELTGVTATLHEGETLLQFEDVRLETGPISSEGLSPVDSLPALLEYIRSGNITQCGSEPIDAVKALRIQCGDPEAAMGSGTEAVLWFDQETHALLQGELRSDGFTVIQCTFTAFTKE